MLYIDNFEKYLVESTNAIKELLETATKNQVHNGDLLLVALGGHYKPNKAYFNAIAARAAAGIRLREYDIEDHDVLQPELESNYVIKSISEQHYIKSDRFKKQVQEIYDTKDADQISKFWRNQETIIGLEFLIYLKIWEMDSYMRKVFQLSELAVGKEYDWFLEISANTREMTGTLHKYKKNEVRVQIINNLKKANCNAMLDLIETGYNNHLRNSIAHSQYFFMNQKIDLTKYEETIEIDGWLEKLYPLTLALYQAVRDEMQDVVLSEYQKLAAKNNNRFPILLGDKTGANLVFHPEMGDVGKWRF